MFCNSTHATRGGWAILRCLFGGPLTGREQQGSQNGTKRLPRYPGWFPQLSWEQLLFRLDPHQSETVIWCFFGPFRAFGTWRNSGPRRKTRKTQFPGARGTFGGEIRPPTKFLLEIPQLFYFFPPGPPRTENCKILVFKAILAYNTLPTALGKIPGRKQKNAISRY